jgi:arabinan endo-1,5-alpha-L-arabinosidase
MGFTVQADADGDGFSIQVDSGATRKRYFVPTATQQDFSLFFRELSRDFGTRAPHVFAEAVEHPPASMQWRPLLTENVHPQILVGYGDPAVLKAEDGWWLVATSNDAPDAFPILHSTDLEHWEPKGFIFPSGAEPEWAAKGRNMADFWAPEMEKVADEYWTVRPLPDGAVDRQWRAANHRQAGQQHRPRL